LRLADGLPMSPEFSPSAPVELAREPDFRIGALLVRPSFREIGEGSDRALLEPRVMRVLVALARQTGDVVSRDDLIASCWDGRIVGDDAINACVAKVRRTGQAHPGFEIETVPRVGYRLIGGRSASPPASPSDEVILAVLPFENLSPDPHLLYFSEGISEQILQALAQRAGVKVIGRSSSFQFRGSAKVIPAIARALATTHVLDGSVRRSADQVRISAHLIECASQTTVWAGHFEGSVSKVFELEDQVAGGVAMAVRRTLAPAT
jgi:adenylate cyclase